MDAQTDRPGTPRGECPVTPLFLGLQSEVHVWFANPDDCTDPALLGRLERLLDEEERARHRRRLREHHRRLFLVAHALVRTTLSRYLAVPPGAWAFVTDQFGRPEISHPSTSPPLRFNLSHTPGLAVCAVALDRDIGVDVESSRRTCDIPGLARQTMTEAELHAFTALTPERQRQSFFDTWTLKEAYVKARGLGLTLPLRSFGFDPGDPEPHLVPPPGDCADDWQFFTAQPTGEHRLALAIRRARGQDLTVRLRSEVFAPR